MTNRDIAEIVRAQHRAIDSLMARLIVSDITFFPSESGPIWDAVVAGKNLIQILECGDIPEKKPCATDRNAGR